MIAKRHQVLALLLTVIVVACSVIMLSSAAAGQQTTEVQTETNETNQPAGGERITDSLLLVNKSFRADQDRNGTLSLTFDADGPTAITLVDAGAFATGGRLPTKTKVIEGTITVEMPVTRPEGADFVGVTVLSGNTRYAVPHEVDPRFELAAPQPNDWLSMIVGIAATFGLMIVIKRYRERQRDEGVVRVEP